MMRHITWMIYAAPLSRVVFCIILLPVLWIVLAKLCARHDITLKIWKAVNILLLISAVGIILHMTVSSRGSGKSEVFLVPFHAFEEARVQKEMYRSMLMNVLLFVPAGLSLPYVLRLFSDFRRGVVDWSANWQYQERKEKKKRDRRSAFYAVIILILFSILIEWVQYRFSLGRAETDDVLCNMLGAVIGVCGIWFR